MGIFSGTKPTLLAGYIITIVAFVIHLIAFATPYWYVKTLEVQTTTSKAYFGLWRSCGSVTGPSISISKCASTADDTTLDGELTGTQAVECISFILFVAAVVCLTIRMFALKDKDILILVALGLCIAAGVFALIGVVIFGVNEKFKDNLHFSFAFCVIGGVAGFIAGAVLAVDKYKSLLD